MGEYGYNPCQDGLPAKVWECLRRNEDFRAVVQREIERPANDCGVMWSVCASTEANRIASFALAFLLPTIPAQDRYVAAKPGFSIGTPWPRTSTAFRRGLKNLLATEFTPKAWEVARPPVEDMVDPRTNEDNFYSLLGWCHQAEGIWRDYQVVAIPRLIRDDKHRHQILAWIDSVVQHAPRGRNSVKLKSDGGFLGTEAAWEDFLIWEFYREKTGHQKNGRLVAALLRYGGRDLGKVPFDERLASHNLEYAKGVYGKQQGHIDGRIQTVLDAIASVYPKLAAFDMVSH